MSHYRFFQPVVIYRTAHVDDERPLYYLVRVIQKCRLQIIDTTDMAHSVFAQNRADLESFSQLKA